MSQPFLPFAVPDIGDEEIDAVIETLKSGWITTGPKAKLFEAEFAAYLGGNLDCIAVNSATAGLHLALEALCIGPGDEVLVPTLTFTTTAEVVRYLGADPVLLDIDPISMNLDVTTIRAAITPRTKAIIPVHYAGLACQMGEVFSIAAEFGLKVVEDAAHALPATFEGNLIGQLPSDVTVFSFYANKTMTTGEGGMAITRNPDLANRMRVMRLHGISRDAFDRFTSTKPSWNYEVVAPGFKYNLTDIASALGTVQLRRLPDFLKRRQQIAAGYFEALKELPLMLPADARDGEIHAWHLYVIRLSDQLLEDRHNRDQVIQALSDKGIGTSVHYVPLHRHPYWRERYELTPEMFPVADKAFQAMLSIPLYTAMTDADQQRVIDAFHTILR